MYSFLFINVTPISGDYRFHSCAEHLADPDKLVRLPQAELLHNGPLDGVHFVKAPLANNLFMSKILYEKNQHFSFLFPKNVYLFFFRRKLSFLSFNNLLIC